MTEDFDFFVGIDLGHEQHQVCAIDGAGEVVGERSFAHTGAGVADLLGWLRARCGAEVERVAIGLENPRGALIEAFLEHHYSVFAINPKQLDRFRDRFSMAGAKDDRRDAWVCARSLRSDRDCFRRLTVDAPGILRLRELSRASDSVGEDFRRAANQLSTLLRRYFPELLTLSPAADEPWLWTLLELAPLPVRAARLSQRRLDRLLAQHRIRRFGGEQLGQLLRHPALPMAAGAAEAIAEQVLLWLPRLKLLHQQRRDLDRRIEALLDELSVPEPTREHRDVEILRSVPGVGRVVTAAVLSEATGAIAERNYPLLRALAGTAPVTHQSGKTRLVSMRYACNRRLRDALYHAACIHMLHDERARQHYQRLRQRGHSHGRAARGLADRLLAMLIAMLQNQTLYDPNRRKLQAA